MSHTDLQYLTIAALAVIGLASLVMLAGKLHDLARARAHHDRPPRPVQQQSRRDIATIPTTYDDYDPRLPERIIARAHEYEDIRAAEVRTLDAMWHAEPKEDA